MDMNEQLAVGQVKMIKTSLMVFQTVVGLLISTSRDEAFSNAHEIIWTDREVRTTTEARALVVATIRKTMDLIETYESRNKC